MSQRVTIAGAKIIGMAVTVHPWDDFGLCDRLVDRFASQLRFLPGKGKDGTWMICESGAWRECSVAEPKRLAQQLIMTLPDTEAGSYSDVRPSPGKPSPRELFLRWCARNRSRGSGVFTSTVLLARDHPRMRSCVAPGQLA